MPIKKLELLNLDYKRIDDDRINDPEIRSLCHCRTDHLYNALFSGMAAGTQVEFTSADLSEVMIMCYLQGQLDVFLGEEEDEKEADAIEAAKSVTKH